MANTTFTGPVISNAGFQVSPVVLADGDITITKATHGGRINLVPDGGQDNTYTLPAPEAGVSYRFVYAGGAADATDAIIVTPGNTNFYVGGVTFLDTDGNEVSSVFSDGDSNSSIQLNVPAGFDVTIIGKDSTNYQIFGNVTSTTAPAFADQ
jgi:hypothetical protein|tara:strand:+ start:947 stop:1402 length:456 start_codon:yes stop_codon:yes gene_type:complete